MTLVVQWEQDFPCCHQLLTNTIKSNYLFSFQGIVENITQHQSMEERIEAANVLKPSCRDELYVDYMTNEANQKYGAFPERVYVIYKGKIEYFGDVGPMGYTLEPVQKWLEEYCTKK